MKRDTVITCVEPNRRTQTMTTILDVNYQQLEPYSEGDGENQDEDQEETPQESGVIIHVVPESSKARWNHIEDLDSFFTRMYHYHQNNGFICMMIEEFFELGQFIFVVLFTLFLFHCVEYPILFRSTEDTNSTMVKVKITDAFLPPKKCSQSMGLVTWIFISIASIFWILRLIKCVYHLTQFWDIKLFFNNALKIEDKDLQNVTWHEVQKKVREVQKEQEMCVHKKELTELDIYHRILRFKNYMVAMINKSLLPVKLQFPIVGEVIFLSRGLKYNLELLLFWGPWSPFENNWHLKEEYKKSNKREELAAALSKHIAWVAIANFVLCPLIFTWQILYFIFNYGDLIKREPGALGLRMWSPYSRLYLRHFNELEHELHARLSRAYRPAKRYVDIFTSPKTVIFAKNFVFFAGSIWFVMVMMTLVHDGVLTVEYFMSTLTILGITVTIARAFLPDENLVWCPETLLTAVLAHTHYRPDSWRGRAHTLATRAQVAQLFHLKVTLILEELISPLLTPFILYFRMRPRALDIVDFYRNFTVEITGVGDVCSFAQMDVRKHGNPTWQTGGQSTIDDTVIGFNNRYGTNKMKPPTQYTQAEDGKTELSLIHFTLTNPEWKPPSHAETFVTALKERARREIANVPNDMNPLYESLNSLCSLGPGYNDIVTNIIRSTIANQVSVLNMNNEISNQAGTSTTYMYGGESSCIKSSVSPRPLIGHINKSEGPLYSDNGLLSNLHQGLSNQSLGASVFGSGSGHFSEFSTPINMATSTLVLHDLHHSQVRGRGYQGHQETTSRSIWQRSPIQELAVLPEVRQERAPLLRHQDSSRRFNVTDS